MEDWRERTELQVGKDGVQKLENACVAIIGLGGVGAFAAEMLCRAGVGSFILADSDVIDVTNKNRQLPALDSTIGKVKTEVIAERMRDINKDVKVKIISTYIEEDNLNAKLKLRAEVLGQVRVPQKGTKLRAEVLEQVRVRQKGTKRRAEVLEKRSGMRLI